MKKNIILILILAFIAGVYFFLDYQKTNHDSEAKDAQFPFIFSNLDYSKITYEK